MDKLTAPLLVLIDFALDSKGILTPTSADLDLLSGAHALTSAEVVALIPQKIDAQTAAAISGAGADQIFIPESELPPSAAALADAVVSAARLLTPAVVLLVSSYQGKEIAGRAAVRLNSACACDVTDLEVHDGALHASKLVLSGSWNTTMAFTAEHKQTPILALRPGMFANKNADLPAPAVAAVAPVQTFAVELTAAASAVQVLTREPVSQSGGVNLSEATTAVVGGRGVDGNFALVRSLAQQLGAAVGATRVACDEGWIERSAQIGQTGLTISPRLYIGLGVSGAIHHVCGIQGAGAIVAVCDDPEAPIFQIADFGIVGDVNTVVPQLEAELKRLGK